MKGQIDLKQISLIEKIERLKGKVFQVDALRLQQVLINLITNAIKYSPIKAEIIIDVNFRQI